MSNKLRALDFFCGAGGLSCGLRNAGVDVTAGFDKDARCSKTYEYNNPGSKFHEADIRHISLETLRKATGIIDFTNMLFAGCAPCQPFSKHQKGSKIKKDATLLLQFGRLIEAAKPAFVFMENVPGIVKVPGFNTFKRFLVILNKTGYKFDYKVVDAKGYGVPQSRKRVVLLATRIGEVSIPAPVFGMSKVPFRTVREAISSFPSIKAGETHPNIPNHTAAALREINIRRMIMTPKNGGDRSAWPEKLKVRCHQNKYKGHTDVYGRMYWGNPAPALTSRCNSVSNGRYGHPEQDRAISLREAAAIQSFPDDYIFFGNKNHIALQIGNAVPVLLAQIMAEELLKVNRNGG